MKLYQVHIAVVCAPKHICICHWSWKICGPEIPPLEIRKTFNKRAGDGFQTGAAHVEELNEVALVELLDAKSQIWFLQSLLHVSISNETNLNKSPSPRSKEILFKPFFWQGWHWPGSNHEVSGVCIRSPFSLFDYVHDSWSLVTTFNVYKYNVVRFLFKQQRSEKSNYLKQGSTAAVSSFAIFGYILNC